MKNTKTTITIDSGIYANQEYPAYAREGLAVFKMYRKYWVIGSIFAKKLTSRLLFKTKKEACERRDAILEATPSIDWTGEVDMNHPEIQGNLDLLIS